jgi:hypothetical protein
MRPPEVEDELVAVIPEGANNAIHIRIRRDRHGGFSLDLRVWRRAASGEWFGTSHGLMVIPEHIRDFFAAINQTDRIIATRRGGRRA